MMAGLISWNGLILMSLALLLYTYVGYPLLLAMISVFCRTRKVSPGYAPKLTVVIAAYNEEASIEAKLKNTLSLNYPLEQLEILVASDGSTDNTEEIVQCYSLLDRRVKLIKVPVRRGKTNAQNVAVRSAAGQIIVFSDATAIYGLDSLLYIAANYQDLKVGAVSGRYVYFDPGGSSTAFGSTVFWGYENIIKFLQSRIYTLTGCSGCIYSVRRDLYVQLPIDSCSDLVEPLLIVQKGYRVVFEPRALATEAATDNSSQEFRMRVRVIDHGIHSIFVMRDLLKFWKTRWIAFQLLSHKVMRWLVPIILCLLLLGTALSHSLWARSLLLTQVAFYMLAAVAYIQPPSGRYRVLTLPIFFCTLNLAVLVGLFHLARGNRFTVWETIRQKNHIQPDENSVPQSK